MIKLTIDGEEALVEIAGKELEILDAADDYVLAECDLGDLAKETAASFPEALQLEIHSEDGFGTYFFYDLRLSHDPAGVALEFRCHTPNKYWEGRFGLATFIGAMKTKLLIMRTWRSRRSKSRTIGKA